MWVEVRLIGYWWSGAAPEWPDPRSLVDETWDADERETVASYVAHGSVARAYMGTSTCRLCGCANGNLELTDGAYLWPSGLAHYVSAHAVRLPEEFVAHVREREVEMENIVVDEQWWFRWRNQ